MKTQIEIENMLISISTQGTDGENPAIKQLQAQANILAWVLEQEKPFDKNEFML